MNSYSCDVIREMAKYDLRIRRGNVNVHRDKEIVEKFNQTLGEHLFTFQYSPGDGVQIFRGSGRIGEAASRNREVVIGGTIPKSGADVSFTVVRARLQICIYRSLGNLSVLSLDFRVVFFCMKPHGFLKVFLGKQELGRQNRNSCAVKPILPFPFLTASSLTSFCFSEICGSRQYGTRLTLNTSREDDSLR
ncbi:hypothetical protein pdam_00018015 [Pocillopora damicornis]|uniref:Uncharacterized protein n=1 Tax=Pocillopora damicornis TaxID=46731 RepID=A0A3M6TF38_POCDA|nr:hypothetical protein pdam_00018015 [Pocillopora damicornis]